MYGFIPEPDNPKHLILEGSSFGQKLLQSPLQNSDLRVYSGNRHQQLNTSSCVGNAVIKALEINEKIKKGTYTDLSRLAVYFLARELMGPQHVQKDAGCYISAAMDALRRFGVCEENMWPFDPLKVNLPPFWSAMRKAYKHKITDFYKIEARKSDRVDQVIKALAGNKPVVFGTNIGNKWSSYNGKDALGIPKETTGAHATVLLGWNGNFFIGENSWGRNWGNNGFYTMTPEYVAWDSSRDFWVMGDCI